LILASNPILKIEGRSGCRLEILNKNDIFFVRKFSKDKLYNARLMKQAQKQRIFFQSKRSSDFLTPEVLAINEAESWFEMPYLHGQTFSEFFERSSIVEIKALAKKLNDYFVDAFAAAEIQSIDAKIFEEKWESLNKALANREDIDRGLIEGALSKLRTPPGSTLPVGTCHGDFTFSNMVFCADGIYLVDFLDSFVESPLMDLVKLRQDTFFYWSLMIENKLPSDRKSKVVQIFNYLDTEVVEGLNANVFVEQWYEYLQIFNLLRILPYVDEASEVQFVEQGIRKLLNK
jgi:thiamine kinase-like enzyme